MLDGISRGRNAFAVANAPDSVRLQSNLLSQHDVAGDQMTDWRKAPTNFGVSSVVHLMHVRPTAMVDTVTLSGCRSRLPVEISRGVELCCVAQGRASFSEGAGREPRYCSRSKIFCLARSNIEDPGALAETYEARTRRSDLSTADKPREEHCFFCGWIKRPDSGNFASGGADSRGKPVAG